MSEPVADFGVIGLAVMGRNLALNVADRGFRVAVYNRSKERTEALLAEEPGAALVGCWSLDELVAALKPPRRLLLMVKAGAAVDQTIDQLTPLLAAGDIVIDGGNSLYTDTREREERLRAAGLQFVGCGISGGEEGARHGPSLMPGGSVDAWQHLRPILEAIAAKTESGPCVTHVGPDGAGHFVKMVHNGIEYGDMQLIAEAYDVMRRGLGIEVAETAEIFAAWNEGALESFLIEITAVILRVRDARSGAPLVELVLDRAGQKGTGRWTVQAALDQGVAIPTIAAALDARVLSSAKALRETAEAHFGAAAPGRFPGESKRWITALERALYAAKVCSYAQGLALIRSASDRFGWGVSLAEMARIWMGGCIIRARMLDAIHAAFQGDAPAEHLLLAPALLPALRTGIDGAREIVAEASRSGLPVPAFAASLGYFDSFRTGRLPQNLTQAQRDAFGAHTFLRTDDPGETPVHFDWLGAG
jgi:6-phosphogluconate dehydrogenase